MNILTNNFHRNMILILRDDFLTEIFFEGFTYYNHQLTESAANGIEN